MTIAKSAKQIFLKTKSEQSDDVISVTLLSVICLLLVSRDNISDAIQEAFTGNIWKDTGADVAEGRKIKDAREKKQVLMEKYMIRVNEERRKRPI